MTDEKQLTSPADQQEEETDLDAFTESIDFTPLLKQDVTLTGSFDLKGIQAHSFRKLLHA